MLDRMAPNGTWYDSALTAEAEEPIGYIVKIWRRVTGKDADCVLAEEHWNAYFKGEAVFVDDGPNVKFWSAEEAMRAVQWKLFWERAEAQKVAQTYDWRLDSNN